MTHYTWEKVFSISRNCLSVCLWQHLFHEDQSVRLKEYHLFRAELFSFFSRWVEVINKGSLFIFFSLTFSLCSSGAPWPYIFKHDPVAPTAPAFCIHIHQFDRCHESWLNAALFFAPTSTNYLSK